MGKPDPDNDRHANRMNSTPWISKGALNCFSRGDFLTDKSQTAFAKGQSMSVGSSTGESKKDAETWPSTWPKTGRVLGVPKCVILSSLPFWTTWWPDGYFNGPRDIIGLDSTGALVNYYYFEQWNGTTDDLAPGGGSYSPTSPFFNNFYNPNSSDPRRPPKDLYSTGYDDLINDRISIGPNLISPVIQPPSERFNQIVGRITNPYYTQHVDMLQIFSFAKKILEEEHNIWVIMPDWMRPQLYQIRNLFLTKNRTKRSPAHGGAANGRSCDVTDAAPCYSTPEVAWGPAYPNTNDARNYISFKANQVPFLTSADPGFGLNMLHIYVGHPCIRYDEGNDPWGYQAWPSTPEALFLGPDIIGTYLQNSDLTPFFNGRRNLWNGSGLDYGFTGPNAVNNIYNHYLGIYQGGISKLKSNFYKYRNFTTKIFTYSHKWQYQWELSRIREDRRNDCEATQFYSGFDFAEFAGRYDSVDLNITDCSGATPAHLTFGETHNYFPSQAEINYALTRTFPPITNQIMNYYDTIEPGCAALYQAIIDRNDLARYNVSYEGNCSKIVQVGDLVKYVVDYFKKNP